jgi:hypothetical protein
MDCAHIEQRLSEYLESTLSAEERAQVAKHLKSCPHCTALLEEMRSAVALCRKYPVLEMEPDLVEKILLRTSGRPRTRSFRERFEQYLLRPLLTPRFAVGTGLATVFLILTVHMLVPRMSVAWSHFSPPGILQLMDRGVQSLYGQGLKVYEKKNEWQAQFRYFKNTVVNKMRFMIEKMEVPVEGRKKLEDPVREREKTPRENYSRLLFLRAGAGFSAPTQAIPFRERVRAWRKLLQKARNLSVLAGAKRRPI